MRDARARDAREKTGVLAVCMTAWRNGDETTDGEVGSLMVAEFMMMIRHALTKK
jgi:hypothetical protein